MSQDYIGNIFDPEMNVELSMTRIEDNFTALKSNSSGPNEPDYAEDGTFWYKTQVNEGLQIKVNGGFLAVMMADTDHKVWTYKNDSTLGWTIDSSIADTVLSLTGGMYGVVGGTPNGSWNQPIHNHDAGVFTFSHSHAVTAYNDPFEVRSSPFPADPLTAAFNSNPTSNTGLTGSSGGAAEVNTWRPVAAVGIIQYPTVIGK